VKKTQTAAPLIRKYDFSPKPEYRIPPSVPRRSGSAPGGVTPRRPWLCNGQVVVGGFIANASPIFGGIARLDANGDLDTTFGNGGTVTVDNDVTALLIDTNGDIRAIEGTGNDGIVVAAYLAN